MAEPLQVLVDDGGEPLPLGDELTRLYGGPLSLPPTALYANFVQSIDGVVAMAEADSSGSVISGKSPADRFAMGLLRATADAVLVGAGTMRDTPNHHWTADHVFPELQPQWRQLRAALGTSAQPRLVLLSASGAIDVGHPAVRGGATILTTRAGARRLGEIAPGDCEVRAFDSDRVPLREAFAWLREQGYARILTEAGPHVTGQLLREGLLDDIFVTQAPVLAGRDGGGRLGLVEGAAFLPKQRLAARLTSARRSGDFLLLRYTLG